METLVNLVKKAGFFGSIVFLAGLAMLSIATVTGYYRGDLFISILLMIGGAGLFLVDISLREFRVKASLSNGSKVFCGIMMSVLAMLLVIAILIDRSIDPEVIENIVYYINDAYPEEKVLMLFPVFLGIGVIVCFICAFLDKKKN